MIKINVTKYDGRKEPYKQDKVLGSIVRSGVKKSEVTKILAAVEAKLYEGMPTVELYQIVREAIGDRDQSYRYRLREALAQMGPFDFEKFIKKVLEVQGYQCQWNQVVRGFCVEHQLDVIAQDRQHRWLMVEVKHHRRFHRQTDLGTVTELWARFEDLKNGFSHGRHRYNFSTAWLITNTKFSSHSKKYSRCKGLKTTGWRYTLNGQREVGLEKMIEDLGPKEVDKLLRGVFNKGK